MPATPCKAVDVTVHPLKTHLHKKIYIPGPDNVFYVNKRPKVQIRAFFAIFSD